MHSETEDRTAVLKRTTFIVTDAGASARFYREVFGWTVWYDNVLRADPRFPPSGAAHAAEVRLIILQAEDPKIGKLGLLEYLQPPFDTGCLARRDKVRMGEPILVIECEDVDGVWRRARRAGATVVTEPVDWEVPTPDGAGRIRLRTVSLFDPNGIYMEVSAHP
jgi:catechol 2,3-dioxygenase-like lactoylglutathione lyase family enzyme